MTDSPGARHGGLRGAAGRRERGGVVAQRRLRELRLWSGPARPPARPGRLISVLVRCWCRCCGVGALPPD
jgi:hypothetical protein